MREEHQYAGIGNGKIRSKTSVNNWCYSCGHWDHLSYRCQNKKALFAKACRDVAWNEDSYNYSRKGTCEWLPCRDACRHCLKAKY